MEVECKENTICWAPSKVDGIEQDQQIEKLTEARARKIAIDNA